LYGASVKQLFLENFSHSLSIASFQAGMIAACLNVLGTRGSVLSLF
jgi:hypothetical protein